MRKETSAPTQSRFQSFFEELERKKDTMSKQEGVSKPMEDVELQGDRQAKDCRVEEKLEAKTEPAASVGANDVDDKDNGSLDHNQGDTVRSTCEEPACGYCEEASNSAHGMPVDGHCQNQSLDDTHEDPVNASHKEAMDGADRLPNDGDLENQFLDNGRNKEHADGDRNDHFDSTHEERVGGNLDNPSIDGTPDEPVGSHDKHSLDDTHEVPVDSSHDDQLPCDTHQEPVNVSHDVHADGAHEQLVAGDRGDQFLDGTREAIVGGAHDKSGVPTCGETVSHKCEELDSGTISSTKGESDPGSHDELVNKDSHEATATGTLQTPSSHHEHESSSEPQPERPRYRGKPKYKRLVEFDNLRPSL